MAGQAATLLALATVAEIYPYLLTALPSERVSLVRLRASGTGLILSIGLAIGLINSAMLRVRPLNTLLSPTSVL